MNNFRNRLISKKQLSDILGPIRAYNHMWYQRAFACKCFHEQLKEEKSDLTSEGAVFEKSNETLEIVGDGIMGAIVVEYLEERFSDQNEGFISVMKMDITRTEGLCGLAKRLNFSEYMLLSSKTESEWIKINIGDDPIYGRHNPELLENCFEAFVGALYLDYKYEKGAGEAFSTCRRFIVGLIEKHVDFQELILCNDNYKSILQQYFLSRHWPVPEYTDLYTELDKDRHRIYARGIYVDRYLLTEEDVYKILDTYKNSNRDKRLGIVKGSKILLSFSTSYRKKKADQSCAKSALSILSPESLVHSVRVKAPQLK